MAARKSDPSGGRIQNFDSRFVDKEKGAIKLRTRERANGCFVIYLDMYIGEGRHKCEAVNVDNQPLYLVPENGRNDTVNKTRNNKTWEQAKAIKAQRIIDKQNGELGIKQSVERSNTDLLKYVAQCYEEEKASGRPGKGTRFQTLHAQLQVFAAGQRITFAQIDKSFLMRFIEFLRDKAVFTSKCSENPPRISKNTQVQIFRTLSAVLSKAVDKEIIDMNPCFQLDRKKKIHREKTRINYLTVEEVQRLIDTPCKWEVMKRAFLFSCSTGLRYSDVSRLTWGDIQDDAIFGKVMKIKVQKTSREEIFPLPAPALQILPERNGASDNDVIFPLKYNYLLGIHLQKWVDDAGINKKIRFHSSRHTMATISLHLGAPIETVSKLLGHSEIRTTEIYAEVLAEDKKKAVALQDNIFKFDTPE